MAVAARIIQLGLGRTDETCSHKGLMHAYVHICVVLTVSFDLIVGDHVCICACYLDGQIHYFLIYPWKAKIKDKQ